VIEKQPVRDIRPGWATRPADRYQAHPDLRFAVIQLIIDPGNVYVVTDQELPVSVQHAVEMIAAWREAHERSVE